MNPLTTEPDTATGNGAAPVTPGLPVVAGPGTLGEMILDAAERYSGVALQYTRDGRPGYVSYSELGTISSEIARGLISLGIEPGDRVAILALTSADWTLRLRLALRGRDCHARLPHQLARGVCVRARTLRRALDLLRER